jgi:hypothetical protein
MGGKNPSQNAEKLLSYCHKAIFAVNELLSDEENPLEDFDLLDEPDPRRHQYLSYRFNKLDINEVTVENHEEKLVPSLAQQVEMFIPPSGGFEDLDLRRYLELVKTYETSSNDLVLGLSLADQIRITFSDMKPATICERFPDIDLATKRRYRCVAEYLLRQNEIMKLRDENGKLIKKIGNMQKMVVIYQPLPRIRETLKRSGLGHFVKFTREELEQQRGLAMMSPVESQTLG